MGCRCCRMIKSYIHEPSEAVDVRKSDSAGSSLYHAHHLPGRALGSDALGGHGNQKQGFHNLGYSKSYDSTLKLEVDNNHVNQRLHAAPPSAREQHQQQASALPAEGGLYIIQPDATGPRWMVQEKTPSQVPVYPSIGGYEDQRSYGEQGHRARTKEWDSSITKCATSSESLSADEVDEGVGGTPEYPCDTGDESSVLSVDIHTSNTSLSSADTRDELGRRRTLDVSTMESGISVTKGEYEEEEAPYGEDEEGEVQSVTDSMVAEALAALEAATAGEDFD